MTDASTPERTYWYQCQEQSMAPGIGDGWPEIIPAPHTPNARLKRMEGDPTSELATLRARVAELEGVVERLPMTADGIRFVRGTVYCHGTKGGVSHISEYEAVAWIGIRESWIGGTSGINLSPCYSTREAAEAARAGQEGE